jgi:phytanoyl-CoA hydroxylase
MARALTRQQLGQFLSDGFVVLRQQAPRVLTSSLAAISQDHLEREIAPIEYEADLRYPGAPSSRDQVGGSTARRLLSAYARGPAFADWAGSPAITEPLYQLLGSDVRLSQVHHNCVMTKQPRFSSVTGWHQDIRYWAFDRPDLISVWLALGREGADNGCLSFLPGTHAMGIDRDRLDDALFLREDMPENRALIATLVTPTLEPGDAVFFHARTFHSAGRNMTQQAKLSLVFTYHAEDNAPVAHSRSASLPSIAVR